MTDDHKPGIGLQSLLIKYVCLGFIFTVVIGVFSVVMAGVASLRGDISATNLDNTALIYNGPLEQSAPTLNSLDSSSDLYVRNNLSPAVAKRYSENTFLTSTNANVTIDANFVKKGLEYEPAYKTSFEAEYVLENRLSEQSFVAFQFPFPANSDTTEISNAKLFVDGKEVQNAKAKIYTLSEMNSYSPNTNSLKWEGKIPASGKMTVKVTYDTVGLSVFTYRGIENPQGAQDFFFNLQINGTRAYNVVQGLSVDQREFGADYVKLVWTKQALFSSPLINVEVGSKLNPSIQVSRVYLTMAPIYVLFISTILYLAYRFAKPIKLFDMFLITVLFTVFFPFVHYLSSFTVDPTIEIFSGIANVQQFSMSLYGAFAIAWIIIGGIIFYLLGRITSFKFATKLGIPLIVLFLGFFPLVVTIPEYSMLLVMIGVITLIAIAVQVRIRFSQAVS